MITALCDVYSGIFRMLEAEADEYLKKRVDIEKATEIAYYDAREKLLEVWALQDKIRAAATDEYLKELVIDEAPAVFPLTMIPFEMLPATATGEHLEKYIIPKAMMREAVIVTAQFAFDQFIGARCEAKRDERKLQRKFRLIAYCPFRVERSSEDATLEELVETLTKLESRFDVDLAEIDGFEEGGRDVRLYHFNDPSSYERAVRDLRATAVASFILNK